MTFKNSCTSKCLFHTSKQFETTKPNKKKGLHKQTNNKYYLNANELQFVIVIDTYWYPFTEWIYSTKAFNVQKKIKQKLTIKSRSKYIVMLQWSVTFLLLTGKRGPGPGPLKKSEIIVLKGCMSSPLWQICKFPTSGEK